MSNVLSSRLQRTIGENGRQVVERKEIYIVGWVPDSGPGRARGHFILLSAQADVPGLCTCCGCSVSFICSLRPAGVFCVGVVRCSKSSKGRDRRHARDHIARENKDGRQREAVSGCTLTQLNCACHGDACACSQDWHVFHRRDRFITDH